MNQEKISKLIKNIRESKNLTQQEFASLFHVTYQAVSKWERGLNMPDINILKSICDKYNLDINDFLEGNKKHSNKKYILISLLFLIILSFALLFFNNKPNYEFKPLTSSCRSFDIKGSIAYNEKDSSIYISDITYCESLDTTKYSKINSSLHEMNGHLIKEGNTKENITIEEYLTNLSFYVEHYTNKCDNNKEYYLEIEAFKTDQSEVKYKIPLKC